MGGGGLAGPGYRLAIVWLLSGMWVSNWARVRVQVQVHESFQSARQGTMAASSPMHDSADLALAVQACRWADERNGDGGGRARRAACGSFMCRFLFSACLNPLPWERTADSGQQAVLDGARVHSGNAFVRRRVYASPSWGKGSATVHPTRTRTRREGGST
jgi:hypothetical protein